MKRLGFLLAILGWSMGALAQDSGSLSGLLPSLPEPHDYVLKRVSSYDRTGANADFRRIAPGARRSPCSTRPARASLPTSGSPSTVPSNSI
jgi:hypothetical protein